MDHPESRAFPTGILGRNQSLQMSISTHRGIIDARLCVGLTCAVAHRRSRQQQSDLLKLNQRAAKILGMQKQHRLAVRADTRLSIPQHAGAARF